jgi:hypothetical protein
LNYNKQHRGNHAAYKAYFAGMNSSMQQKVALTTAHFPVRGNRNSRAPLLLERIAFRRLIVIVDGVQ